MKSGLPEFVAKPCGDSAMTIEFGSSIDPHINACVNALDRAVKRRRPAGIVETIPTYRSLMVHYDPVALSFAQLSEIVSEIAATADVSGSSEARKHWKVPVVYGGDFGIDLEEVASQSNLSCDDVIELHTSRTYLVYQFGFLPGIALLGKNADCLERPRRAEPRMIIPGGSIVIAGLQTGIISLPVHSGWHILGRTPVRSFDLDRDPMFIFNPGDTVSFCSIEQGEWDRMDKAAAAGELLAELVTPCPC